MVANTNNIIIKDRYGNDVVYEGVSRIRTGTTEGGTKEFVIADDIPSPVETTVELDFSEGDMEVVPDDNTVFSKVGIHKPDALISENIAEGVEVAGVVGTLDIPDVIETTVDLDFSESGMEVMPEEGAAFSKVNILKPETLIPENIAEGIDIAGIIGTLISGNGGNSGIVVDIGVDQGYNGTRTFNHNLGSVPDVIILIAHGYVSSYNSAYNGKNIMMAAIGMTKECKDKYGLSYYQLTIGETFASNTIKPYHKWDSTYSITDASGFIRNAGAYQFKAGDSTTWCSTQTQIITYIAIGGLT